MYEDRTYEALVKRALARVPPSIDKREGSMVFNGVAPSMAELAQLYIEADFIFKATYLLTAPREYLIKRAYERGSNENMNRLIRRFFPKGTNFDEVTKEQVAAAEKWVNNYPRKLLGWKSAAMLFNDELKAA